MRESFGRTPAQRCGANAGCARRALSSQCRGFAGCSAPLQLRWLQRALASPIDHAQTLMGWFGDLALGGASALDTAGHPTPAANPHAQLLWADLQRIASIADMQDWGRRWAGDLRALLPGQQRDADLVDELLRFDPSYLRAAFVARSLPADAAPSGDAPTQVDPEYICTLRVGSGEICGTEWRSLAAMLHHQRGDWGGDHGVRALLTQCVVTHVCLWCRTSFASTQVALQHMQRAHAHRRCIDASRYLYPQRDVRPAQCRVCAAVFEDTSSLLDHIARAHLPAPEGHLLVLDAAADCDPRASVSVWETIRAGWLRRRGAAREAASGGPGVAAPAPREQRRRPSDGADGRAAELPGSAVVAGAADVEG